MKPESRLWFELRHGPYPLMNQDIDKYVAENRLGNYLLGSITNGEFIPRYTGRSDSDINRRLKEHIDERYSHFKFEYAKIGHMRLLNASNSLIISGILSAWTFPVPILLSSKKINSLVFIHTHINCGRFFQCLWQALKSFCDIF
jgi:hypothetical protein